MNQVTLEFEFTNNIKPDSKKICTKCNKPNDNKKSIWCHSCIESSKKKSVNVKTEIKPIIEKIEDKIEIPKGNFHSRFSEMYNKTWKKNPE